MNADELATVAIGLAVRVRDDNPDANARWLYSQINSPEDLRDLCFVLAAAVPIEVPWRLLTDWINRADAPWSVIEERRKVLDEALRPNARRKVA